MDRQRDRFYALVDFPCFQTVSVWSALLLVISANSFARASTTNDRLFDVPPPVQADEILLLSTRRVGVQCDTNAMRRRLQCCRHQISLSGRPEWKTIDWRRSLSPVSSKHATIIYVHGNRVAPGDDQRDALRVYRSLKSFTSSSRPIRLIVWSWPSTPILRPMKDLQVKAHRTDPVAWQLAWYLDKLPKNTNVSIVGYSYGARVVSGAFHLLAGGRLGKRQLTDRLYPQRKPMRVALLAAAYDADWIEPGERYGQAMQQAKQLVVAVNRRDPAMRFYHLANGRGHVDALGKHGIPQPQTLGSLSQRVQHVDFTTSVGRSHALKDYLAATDVMAIVWNSLLAPPSNTPGKQVVAR